MAKFGPGNTFGKRNKGKRVSGPAKLAARVRRITKDGRLILDTAVSVMKDPKARAMEKIKAAELLKESGWGLASRGGETEGGGGNITIRLINYAEWKKELVDSSAHKQSSQPSEGTDAQPTEKAAEESSGAGEKEQTGAGV